MLCKDLSFTFDFPVEIERATHCVVNDFSNYFAIAKQLAHKALAFLTTLELNFVDTVHIFLSATHFGQQLRFGIFNADNISSCFSFAFGSSNLSTSFLHFAAVVRHASCRSVGVKMVSFDNFQDLRVVKTLRKCSANSRCDGSHVNHLSVCVFDGIIIRPLDEGVYPFYRLFCKKFVDQ
ncbi:hypothetical protein D3C79_693380 [compost metagenome]